MGSINTILIPEKWKICKCVLNKNCDNDLVYKLLIGYGEDFGYYEIYEYMSVNNYDNLIAGRYSVSVFPYSENKILLFDENGDCIPLVNGLDSVKCKVRK